MASIAITGAVIAIVGAGVSAYGQYQAGKAQNAIAQFNANQQEKQAQAQMMTMQVQAALQRQQAEANFKLRSAEAQAHFNNARAKEDQALTQDAVNRANLIKQREMAARAQATQRATLAAQGVSESTGTPLDLLAETAMKIQQDQEEQHYNNELKRRTLFAEASQERLGGRLGLAGATLDRDSQLAAAALRDAAGQGEYASGLAQADITRAEGRAEQKGAAYKATGTLISGIGSAVGGVAGKVGK